jgi:hypothetical protein
MDHWNLQDVDLNPEEANILKFINAATGHRNMELSRKITYMFSLYPFLVKHKDDDPEQVHQMVTDGEEPMFSLESMTELLNTIKEQSTPDYMNMDISGARQRAYNILKKQHGGAELPPSSKGSSTIEGRTPKVEPYDPMDDMFGATQRPGFVDTTHNGFYDRMARKLQSMYPPTEGQQSNQLDGLFWYVFLLYNLENMDIFGPGFSAALDAYVLGTRVLVDGLDEFVPKLLTMVGGIFPGGGLVGTIGGEMITLIIGDILLLGTVIVSLSRKQFGDAFKNSIEMIPFIGDFLLTFALTVETQLERMNTYRHRYVDMLGQVSPRLERYADYWVPKLEPVTGPPPPPMTFADIQDDVMKKVQDIPGVKDALETAQTVSDPSALLAKAQAQAISTAQRKISEAHEKAQTAVQSALPTMKGGRRTPRKAHSHKRTRKHRK